VIYLVACLLALYTLAMLVLLWTMLTKPNTVSFLALIFDALTAFVLVSYWLVLRG
jgi:hypothetical protein